MERHQVDAVSRAVATDVAPPGSRRAVLIVEAMSRMRPISSAASSSYAVAYLTRVLAQQGFFLIQ